MVVADDPRDLLVVLYLRKDPFTDSGVLLHLPTLVERQWAGLLEQPRREPNFPDVVDEPAQVGKLLLFFGKPHTCCDVPSVDCNCGGMTCCITVPSIQRGNQCCSKGEVRGLKSDIGGREILRERSLILIHPIKPLC